MGAAFFRLGAGFAVAAGVLAIGGKVATIPDGPFAMLDKVLLDWTQKAASPPVTAALWTITDLGSTLVLTIAGSLAVVTFAILGWRQEIIAFLTAMAGQIVLHHGFKAIFDRTRPETLHGYVVGDTASYPSGHALASLTVYVMLATLITRRLQLAPLRRAIWLASVLLISSIAFSRIYFGVHYATDVLAGLIGALLWTAAVAWSFRADRRS